MYKYILFTALVLSGCAYATINSTMCDQVARDPGATIPQECRDYNKKDADKAFHKVVEEKKISDKDIKFAKEENE